MATIQYKNQREYSFLVWVSNFPESMHPNDMDRFYIFVHTLIRYKRSEKWLDFSYFQKRILKEKPNFKNTKIEYFFNELQKLIKFSQKGPISTIEHIPDTKDYAYYEIGVCKGKIYKKKLDS